MAGAHEPRADFGNDARTEMMRRAGVVTCTLLACMAVTSTGFADPTANELEAARKLFKQAEADEAAQKWDVALDDLRRASSIKMTAGLRFHIALCEANLHQNAAALADYTAADLLARTENNSEVQDAVREPRADLDARVPKVKLAVPPDAKNVEVRVDSTVVNDLSEELRLDVGSHTIEAKANGRAPFSKKITLAERDATTIQVSLPLLAAAPKSADQASPEEAPPAGGSSKANHVPAILATAGAVVLVGAGIGSFLIAGGAQSDARDACTNGNADCNGDKSKVHAWDAVALGAWIGAGVVAGLAVYLWVDPPSKTEGNPSHAEKSDAPATANAMRSIRVQASPSAILLQGTF